MIDVFIFHFRNHKVNKMYFDTFNSAADVAEFCSKHERKLAKIGLSIAVEEREDK